MKKQLMQKAQVLVKANVVSFLDLYLDYLVSHMVPFNLWRMKISRTDISIIIIFHYLLSKSFKMYM